MSKINAFWNTAIRCPHCKTQNMNNLRIDEFQFIKCNNSSCARVFAVHASFEVLRCDVYELVNCKDGTIKISKKL